MLKVQMDSLEMHFYEKSLFLKNAYWVEKHINIEFNKNVRIGTYKACK